jgi:hypothetical protein
MLQSALFLAPSNLGLKCQKPSSIDAIAFLPSTWSQRRWIRCGTSGLSKHGSKKRASHSPAFPATGAARRRSGHDQSFGLNRPHASPSPDRLGPGASVVRSSSGKDASRRNQSHHAILIAVFLCDGSQDGRGPHERWQGGTTIHSVSIELRRVSVLPTGTRALFWSYRRVFHRATFADRHCGLSTAHFCT